MLEDNHRHVSVPERVEDKAAAVHRKDPQEVVQGREEPLEGGRGGQEGPNKRIIEQEMSQKEESTAAHGVHNGRTQGGHSPQQANGRQRVQRVLQSSAQSQRHIPNLSNYQCLLPPLGAFHGFGTGSLEVVSVVFTEAEAGLGGNSRLRDLQTVALIAVLFVLDMGSPGFGG